MAFHTIEDLLKALREHPEWLEELRRVVLTEELLQLPERFEQLSAMVQQLAVSVQQLVEQGARHEEEIRQLRKEFHEHRQGRDIAELKGSDRERYYRERAGAIFGRYLRRVRLVDFSELYEELDSREPLTQEELLEVSLLDAVVEGRRRSDGTPVLLAIEASWSIYPDDVQRALARAQIIAKRGYTVYPVVAGKYAEEGLVESARRLGVLVVLDGGRVHGDAALM